MKLSNFLFNIGRPVAFYPGMAKALGSIKQAVFVCQMAYWKDKGSDPDGWIYKSSEEIESETALTYKEQIKVREDLKSKQALEERYARTEHQMYFRVNWDVINSIWDEHLTKGHMPKSQVPPYQKSDGSLPKVSSLNSNTENTTKTTQKKDILDGILHFQVKPSAIKEAIKSHFKLTPNWESKFNREFLQWAIQENTSPEQIKHASEIWRKDKRFNWSHPNLKGIQEHWLQLIEDIAPSTIPDDEPTPEYLAEVAAMFAGKS